MPSQFDVVELVHEMSYLGQQVNNVYYFQDSVGGTPLADLATWFETNVVPDIKTMTADILTHTNLRLRNLFDEQETHEEPLTGGGLQTTGLNEMPAFFALTFRLDHATGGVRPGFKRYAGILEGQIENGIVTAATITQLEAIAANLINPPVDPLAGYVHVIINRVCEELNPIEGEVPRCLKYRLPNAIVEANPGFPTSFEAYTEPTTQNSRKWYT